MSRCEANLCNSLRNNCTRPVLSFGKPLVLAIPVQGQDAAEMQKMSGSTSRTFSAVNHFQMAMPCGRMRERNPPSFHETWTIIILWRNEAYEFSARVACHLCIKYELHVLGRVYVTVPRLGATRARSNAGLVVHVRLVTAFGGTFAR